MKPARSGTPSPSSRSRSRSGLGFIVSPGGSDWGSDGETIAEFRQLIRSRSHTLAQTTQNSNNCTIPTMNNAWLYGPASKIVPDGFGLVYQAANRRKIPKRSLNQPSMGKCSMTRRFARGAFAVSVYPPSRKKMGADKTSCGMPSDRPTCKVDGPKLGRGLRGLRRNRIERRPTLATCISIPASAQAPTSALRFPGRRPPY